MQELRPRWTGTYVIVYDGDTPLEIYVTGCSGD
jgi:endonuclease YncB( thermonuclease family)